METKIDRTQECVNNLSLSHIERMKQIDFDRELFSTKFVLI